MSWLTDLAGKAENLLNKIDQNAATVLKDKNSINEQLQDVIWKTTSSTWTQDPDPPSGSSIVQTTLMSHLPRSAPSGAASPARRLSPSRSDISLPKRSDDDDLLRFLNSSEPLQLGSEDARGSPSGASVPSAGSASPVNIVDIPGGSHSRSHSQGGMSSMSSSYISSGRDDNLYQQCFKPVDGLDGFGQVEEVNQSSVNDVLAENNLLKNEIRCLNNELALMLHRCKAAEKEVAVSGQELHFLKETLTQNKHLESQLQVLARQLKENEKTFVNMSAENKRLKEAAHSPHDETLAKELSSVSEKLKQLEAAHETLNQESNELRLQVSRLQANVADAVQQNERYRSQVTNISSEAEQYRARATRVLQEKEKLIASLQATKQVQDQNSDLVLDQELEQMREELQLLRQESATHAKLLQSARNDLQESELHQEEHRQKAETEIDRLQKKLQEERSRRLTAEEDCRVHLEELQSAKTEMNLQYDYLKECLQSKDAELSKMKQQSMLSSNASQPSTEYTELEARVRNLATALIQKQGALEALIAERNSLRLKLERVELKNQSTSSQASSVNGGTILNVNESENVTRLRVPTLLSENPGDTGVTRRVKRAYSSLDTLGIRVGVFLRRYPLARILLILYMVILHLWVALVLFSYSPEGFSPVGSAKAPPSNILEEPKGVR